MDSVLDPQVSHHGGAVGRGQWMDLPGRGDGGNTIDTLDNTIDTLENTIDTLYRIQFLPCREYNCLPRWPTAPSSPSSRCCRRKPCSCVRSGRYIMSALRILAGTVLYALQCTLYSVHCTPYTLQCTVYNVHCTVYNVQCTVGCSIPNTWTEFV